eukprot:PhM_4_TR743/c0_g1_i1/m.43332/K17816/NUDT1, MTH1; 8-oxo-dGTP diphosphatase / 2-hydroxy-dATP diphosphatase
MTSSSTTSLPTPAIQLVLSQFTLSSGQSSGPLTITDDRPLKRLTLISVLDHDRGMILLGHKARGFGEGKWNGFGGKFDPAVDTTLCECARRELEEEVGLRANAKKMIHRGTLLFYYPPEREQRLMEVSLFEVDIKDCEGEPVASEEMNPIQWFPFDDIPLQSMWADDEFWLPMLVKEVWRAPKKKADGNATMFQFAAVFVFEGLEKIIDHKIITNEQDETLRLTCS